MGKCLTESALLFLTCRLGAQIFEPSDKNVLIQECMSGPEDLILILPINCASTNQMRPRRINSFFFKKIHI